MPSARVPDRFVAQPGAQENVVLIKLEYLGETEVEVQTLQLTFEREGALWLVDKVEPLPAEE